MPAVSRELKAVALTPRAATSSFRNFLTKLKNYSGIGKGTTSEITTAIKEASSGVRSVDDAIKSLPVGRTKQGFLTLAERPIAFVNRILREANLDELVKLTQRNIPIGSVDRKLFAETVGATPERALKNVDDLASVTKNARANLNVTTDAVSQLSDTAKRDLKKVEGNLSKYFKQGTVIALTIGAVYVGVDWITKSTEQRKGCFMLTTIDGKTTSCKVVSYSCVGKGGEACTSVGNYYNVTIWLIAIAALPDTDQRKIQLCTQLNIEPKDMEKSLKSIIDTNYEKAASTIETMERNNQNVKPDICKVKNANIEGGVIPPCRMCSPTANPTSTMYIDPSQYGENITFQCVENPTILDTIADASISTGKNLWEGVTGGIGSVFKRILIGIGVVIGLLVLLSIAFKVVPYFMNRNKTKERQILL